MDVGILGTGNLAVSLGRVWAAAGHRMVIAGRDWAHTTAAAEQIGSGAQAIDPADLAVRADVVIVAVAWEGLGDALALVGSPGGSLAGKTVIDCTNPVDYSTGDLKLSSGSAAEFVARTAPGAHVVKALHLFAGTSWPYVGSPGQQPVVAICGEETSSLAVTISLIADLGARAAVIGGLDSARQLEDTAGFVMRVVAAGYNPRLAVPDVEPARHDAP